MTQLHEREASGKCLEALVETLIRTEDELAAALERYLELDADLAIP